MTQSLGPNLVDIYNNMYTENRKNLEARYEKDIAELMNSKYYNPDAKLSKWDKWLAGMGIENDDYKAVQINKAIDNMYNDLYGVNNYTPDNSYNKEPSNLEKFLKGAIFKPLGNTVDSFGDTALGRFANIVGEEASLSPLGRLASSYKQKWEEKYNR